MYFNVRRRRVLGKSIDNRELSRVQPIYGDVRIVHQNPPELGRPSQVANLVFDNPLESSVIPPLMDVSLYSMATNGFTLSGIEIVDGVAYAQSWLCQSVN
ncbi:hypothetical protein [Stutzerimonas stutzeri]|uniref:hypothetical protein n=1 Tax=Stutzerimonas stutzeri TaxID=316 RepID=UPI00210B31B1|nr:hypothetical protein [Stutzerimonas stutzeri]MCQ4257491.1 hypothetical protein [Stutzerimonas stutzeri]